MAQYKNSYYKSGVQENSKGGLKQSKTEIHQGTQELETSTSGIWSSWWNHLDSGSLGNPSPLALLPTAHRTSLFGSSTPSLAGVPQTWWERRLRKEFSHIGGGRVDWRGHYTLLAESGKNLPRLWFSSRESLVCVLS